MKQSDKKNNNSISRRGFLSITSMASVGLGSLAFGSVKAKAKAKAKGKRVEESSELSKAVVPEWRNRQSDMSYRQLGRTGMMISEVVNGGDPIRHGNTKQVDMALERGLNYFDMAPAYGNGECEKAYKTILSGSAKREKVFMTTKVSNYSAVRDRLYRDIFDGLPSDKQNAIMKRAKEMRAERGVDKPGYYLTYWPGQDRSMDPAYISNAMARDYAHKVDGDKSFQTKITESIEGSLKRVGTDYFDILMCPHGANSPEEVQVPEIATTFDKLKRDGKVRFLGVSTHNDPAGVLRAAADTGHYDVAMCAYNVINGGYLEEAIRHAHGRGMGIIAMKAAMAVATHHNAIKPIPNWRIEKVNRIVPGDLKAPLKAYLWVLQNSRVSAVISNLWNEQFVKENLSIVGKKVELQPG